MELDQVNYIHPTSIISPSVKLGRNNYIGPFCHITGNTVVGDNNRFESHCSIGTPPEHTDMFTYTEGKTVIGNNNIIREFVTIHAGATRTTTIGNNNKILRGAYIGHDTIIEDFVNIAANVLLGGYCYIMEGAKLGLSAVCHQRSKIGAYVMVGMSSVITKTSSILPGNVYIGSPARILEPNDFGLKKSGITKERLNELMVRYKDIEMI